MDGSIASGGRTLWEVFEEIPDRRGAQGRQYPLRSVLTLALAAMPAGANDLRAIFRWGRRLPPEALYLLGIERAPCHATYRYFFKALDATAAAPVSFADHPSGGSQAMALGRWTRGSKPLGHVAIDGKRLRGSAAARHDGREGVHLVSAFASGLGAVIGQLQVAPEGNEITAALALIKSLPLEGRSSPATPGSASGQSAGTCATRKETTSPPSKPISRR